MYELYREWKNGATIKLCFLHKTWDVIVERHSDFCCLGEGWKKFVKESGIELNDILVFNSCFSAYDKFVNVCLIKSDDIRMHYLTLGKFLILI